MILRAKTLLLGLFLGIIGVLPWFYETSKVNISITIEKNSDTEKKEIATAQQVLENHANHRNRSQSHDKALLYQQQYHSSVNANESFMTTEAAAAAAEATIMKAERNQGSAVDLDHIMKTVDDQHNITVFPPRHVTLPSATSTPKLRSNSTSSSQSQPKSKHHFSSPVFKHNSPYGTPSSTLLRSSTTTAQQKSAVLPIPDDLVKPHEQVQFMHQEALRVSGGSTTTTPSPNATSPPYRILFVVSHHEPPTRRIADLLKMYQKHLTAAKQSYLDASHIQIDYYFFCNDNFNYTYQANTTDDLLPCARYANYIHNATYFPVLLLDNDVARPYLEQCHYCQKESAWAWSGYMAPFLALRQLEAAPHGPDGNGLPRNYYDVIWSAEADIEYLGNTMEWIVQQEATLLGRAREYQPKHTPPLVSSVVFPSFDAATKYLQPGMFARIRGADWRWLPHGHFGAWRPASSINFGIIMHNTRFTYDMLDTVEAYLKYSTYVEQFLPWVCDQRYGPYLGGSGAIEHSLKGKEALGDLSTTDISQGCRVANFDFRDIGFFNTRPDVFSGTNSASYFATLALMTESSRRKWYHPVKFKESWRHLVRKHKDAILRTIGTGEVYGPYGTLGHTGLCYKMDCNRTVGAPPICRDHNDDNCWYVVPPRA